MRQPRHLFWEGSLREVMNSRKVVITFANQLAVLVLNVFALKATLAVLSPEDYGLYGYALSLTGLFMVFTELNLSNVYFKRVAEGEPIQPQYSTYVSIRLILAGTAAIFFIFYMVTSRASSIVASPRHLVILVTTLLYYFFDAVMLAIMGAYQAQREVRKTQVTTALMSLANLVFILAFVVTSRNVWFLSLALVVKPLVGIVCFARLMKGDLNIFRFKLDREILADYIRFILPLLPMSILAAIYDRIDGTLVTNFLSYRENGFLTAASMFNTLLLIPSTAILTFLYSSFSEEIRKKNYLRVQEISNRATKYLSLLVSPIAMFFFFNAKALVVIAMSEKYLPAVPIIQVFMFQVVLMSVSRTFGSILLASEKLRVVSTLGIATYVLGIILDFLLIPDCLFGLPMGNLGATGPAYKALIVYIVSIIITGVLLKIIMGITIYWRFIFHVIAAFLAGWIVNVLLPAGNVIFDLALYFMLSGVVYVFFLILLRELKRADADYLCNAFAIWRGTVKDK